MTRGREVARRATPGPGLGPQDVQVLTGAAAWRLLEDPALAAAWDALQRDCPWATVFQSRPFIESWYRAYGARYQPVVCAQSASGELRGILSLARDRADGQLVVAGTHHAEYQTWLAAPGMGDAFALGAWRALGRRWPHGGLRFQFLAPGTPLAWRQADAWRVRTILAEQPRGFVDAVTGASRARTALSRARPKRKRLEALGGPLALRRIAGPAELARVLPEIMTFCDIRQGATHDHLPFRDDPLKAPFHRLLIERAPELLHIVVLEAGSTLVAAHIGFPVFGGIMLGLLTHNPRAATQSPGQVLLWMLIAGLQDEGLAALDLTPGGGFKDRFATGHDMVSSLDVSFGAARGILRHAERSGRRILGLAAERAGLEGELRDRIAAWRAPRRVLGLEATQEAVAGDPDPAAGGEIARDDLSRLLDLERTVPRRRLFSALRLAAALLERGATVLTRTVGGEVTHAAAVMVEEASPAAGGAGGGEAPARVLLGPIHPPGPWAGVPAALLAAVESLHPGRRVMMAATTWTPSP